MDQLRLDALDQLEQRRRTLLRVAAESAETARSQTEQADIPRDRAEPDIASQVREELSTLEQAELQEIEAALVRIHAGAFGKCETCGKAIGRQRLRALPETRYCIGCATNAGNAQAQNLRTRSR